MFNIGGGEMVMLAILALLVFGPEGLPEIMKTVARTVKAFRQAANDFQSEVNTALTLENQKQEVQQRRRKRAAPMEQKLLSQADGVQATPGEKSEQNDTETSKPDLTEAVPGSDNDAMPIPLAATSVNSGTAKPLAAPEEDDDGPGRPMAKATRSGAELREAATDPETVP
jgi:sec-independent protein translocase protein TatB